MKLNFLESGVDSLKKGFLNLLEYENLQYNTTSKVKNRKRFFYLKDSILFIQHGIEILFKQIINKHSEYLLFSQIDDNVKKALKEKNERKLKSVFESNLKHKLHTVTFTESIERLKILPNIKIKPELERKIRELEVYRNIIMHAEPHLNEVEINNTFDGLANELDNFFYKSLGKKYRTISGYSEFVKSFEKFQLILKDKNQHLKAQANEVFMASIKKSNVSMGSTEVMRITDINSCTLFLETIFSSTLKFGTDIYNGHCWGDISSIKRIENDCFRMITNELNVVYDFKLKSIILYFPEIDDQKSPLIFIESDHIKNETDPLMDANIEEYEGLKYVEYYKRNKTHEIIIGNKELEDFHENPKYDREEYSNFYKFYTKGLFCFLNIQGLNFNHGHRYIIKDYNGTDGKDFEVYLRKNIASV